MVARDGRTRRIGPDLLGGGGLVTELTLPGRVVPDGTVTFLLTDVEGSTRRWEVEPEPMGAAVDRHYEILDQVIGAHGGIRPVEQGEGDSVVAVFTRAADAVAAALDAQRRLEAEVWPTSAPLRVRIALHTGDARRRGESNYVGPAIVRTARLRAIAHGGQVIVSSATRDLVVDDLEERTGLVDLGSHRLKDLARPEHVWQLTHPDLQTQFPPLRSLDASPNNLPVPLSTFIGRFDEIDTVVRMVLDNRLVTIMGPGGAGKTRLAQQVGAELVESFPDGVWWIDLVEVSDPALLPSAISRALGLAEQRDDRLGGLARRLADKRTLVILDNCEHVAEAAADAADAVLTAGREVAVLATSRGPLSVPGELSWRVPQLRLPTPTGTDVLDAAARSDAVRLFVDRAVRARSDFVLTDDNVLDVAAICERLDGIPLAIELAAARCRLLSPAQLLVALTDAMSALGSGPRTVDARHQTIERSIEWSHSLLTPTARIVLRRLGVFASSFTVEGATAVCAGDGVDPPQVVTEIERLLDQSLVQMDDQGREPRFRMLETVRQFARRELAAAGELDVVAARHADHFRTRALGLWPLFHEGMVELLDQADAEHRDLVAMLEHLREHATPEEHAEVAMACLPTIGVRHTAEAAALGMKVAERVDGTSLLGGRLHMRLALADPTNPFHVGMSVQAAMATGDPDLTAHADFWSRWQAAGAEPTIAARDELHAALGRLREHGEEHFSRAHWTVAAVDRGMGRLHEAVAEWQLAATETVCKRCNTTVWGDGALLALARGDLGAARAALEKAHGFAAEVRDAAFSANVRLTEVEVAAYSGSRWPAAEVEADLVAGSQNPNAVGYLSEARAIGRLLEGDLGIDDDIAASLQVLDALWAKRTGARLRLITACHARGDHARAATMLDELEDVAKRFDAGPAVLAQAAHRRAALELDTGDVASAEELAHEALVQAAAGPWPPYVIDALELLACVAIARDSHAEGVRLHGAAQHLRDDAGYRYLVEPERGRLQRAIDSARGALGDDELTAARAAGQGLTLDDAIAYARRARGERKRPAHGWDALTPMERQVAQLAIAGLANAEIAERLFIGRETVKTHLSNTYAKVGVANRAQLVADAARHGIT
jgi:predicted ATPase/class 3 adenylate cyclase/DNA-binding CsgD family transcriptional regulator